MYLPDQLQRPWGFGYLGDDPLPQTEVELPRVLSPEQVGYDLEEYREPIPMPDVVKALYGAGDPYIVGQLLNAAEGRGTDLMGVSPTYASHLLTKFGYPTSMDALSGDEWEARIGAAALVPNPMSLLGGF